MKTVLTGLALLALSATPALAQDQAKPPEKPKMCEMMHDGKKMQGMMMKGKDGKMSCQMMDQEKEPKAAPKHDHSKSKKHN